MEGLMGGDRLLVALLAVTTLAACGANKPCEPSCRAGFACVDGACVSSCNPACPAGERCGERGECLAASSMDPADPISPATEQAAAGDTSKSSTTKPPDPPAEPAPRQTTLCGSPEAKPELASLPDWTQHRCADDWSTDAGCYPRYAYSDEPGRGCPGDKVCCQIKRDCRTTWQCREFGWCAESTPGAGCVPATDADCRASARCAAIGTCVLGSNSNTEAGGEAGVDCCTAPRGGYCAVNEVQFEPSSAARKRARTCDEPPPFQGARRDDVPFDVTADAVAAGTVRVLGFGNAMVHSGGEAGTEVTVLYAIDSCGLWLQVESAGWIEVPPIRLERPSYRRVKREADGSFVVRAQGTRLRVVQAEPGIFEVTSLVPIAEYEGE